MGAEIMHNQYDNYRFVVHANPQVPVQDNKRQNDIPASSEIAAVIPNEDLGDNRKDHKRY